MFIGRFEDGSNIAFFQAFGNVSVFKHQLEIISRVLKTEVIQSFSILILIWPWSWALLGSKFWIIFATSSVKIIDEKRLSVKYSSFLGSSQLLLIWEHWSAKKELKSKTFFSKSFRKSFLWYSGGMICIFLLFRIILSKDEWASMTILLLFYNFRAIILLCRSKRSLRMLRQIIILTAGPCHRIQ